MEAKRAFNVTVSTVASSPKVVLPFVVSVPSVLIFVLIVVTAKTSAGTKKEARIAGIALRTIINFLETICFLLIIIKNTELNSHRSATLLNLV